MTYRVAGLILRTGMYLSFGVMLVGLGWVLIAGASIPADAEHHSIALDRLGPELTAGNPLAIVSLGVVLLLFTPGITLLSTIVTFVLARNWRFAGVATLIGATLLFSLSLSLKWIKLF